jgi:hypothetical protein
MDKEENRSKPNVVRNDASTLHFFHTMFWSLFYFNATQFCGGHDFSGCSVCTYGPLFRLYCFGLLVSTIKKNKR